MEKSVTITGSSSLASNSRRIVGTSEMANRIREFPWQRTPAGAISEWPETLLAMVNMMLSTRYPVLLFWGPEMVLLYNDAFRPILTDRHPAALGDRGRSFWIDVWPVVGEQLEGVLREGKDAFHENAPVPILRNGVLEEAYFNYSYSPLYEPDGKVAGIVTLCQETTRNVIADRERDIAQQQLRLRQDELDKTLVALSTERARLLSVVQQAPAFFALLEGPDHVITMVNPLYMKLVGHRDVLGKPVREALPEAIEQGYVELLDRVVSSGEPVTGQSSRFVPRTAEGQPEEERFLDFVYQPLREPDNSISGVLVLGVDITESKRAESALIQTEKLAAVGRLAASIAHEINNPLESVTNLLFLARESGSLEEAQGYLSTAEQELRRMAAITNQTLSFHKQVSAPKTVTCDELLESVLRIYHGRIVNSKIRVEHRHRTGEGLLCFDGEIRQVLNNLVSNAIDAMHGNGGRLLLRSRAATHWPSGEKGVVITVADTGSGIKPEILHRIFEPFFTTKGQSGTGLGLWVSRDIVNRHKGAFRVRSSQRPGRSGSVFTLFLPFEPVRR
jgi:PAS domain S-box-containing protein